MVNNRFEAKKINAKQT